MPWNRPSSQPTSWAWATAELGLRRRRARRTGGVDPGQLLAGGRATAPRWQLRAPTGRRSSRSRSRPASSERRRPHLLEELLDHGADAHDPGRRADRLLGRPPARRFRTPGWTISGCSTAVRHGRGTYRRSRRCSPAATAAGPRPCPARRPGVTAARWRRICSPTSPQQAPAARTGPRGRRPRPGGAARSRRRRSGRRRPRRCRPG